MLQVNGALLVVILPERKIKLVSVLKLTINIEFPISVKKEI